MNKMGISLLVWEGQWSESKILNRELYKSKGRKDVKGILLFLKGVLLSTKWQIVTLTLEKSMRNEIPKAAFQN